MSTATRTTLRTIPIGCEELAPGQHAARHRHLQAYAIVVIRGRFDQVSYAGRVRVEAGDLLVQPTLDAHANRMADPRGARILRLPWPDGPALGGVRPLRDLDAVVRAAERDPREAIGVARAEWGGGAVAGRAANDLPDQLARDLVAGRVDRLAGWAARRGVARETVAREFVAAFGVSARRFRVELKTRAAWLQIVRTRVALADIALASGFADQAHMTRLVRALTGAPPIAWRRAAASVLRPGAGRPGAIDQGRGRGPT